MKKRATYQANCTTCGAIVERSDKFKKLKFTCFICKKNRLAKYLIEYTKKNRKRINERVRERLRLKREKLSTTPL